MISIIVVSRRPPVYDQHMDISQAEYDRIAMLIASDSSPVGIDAKKTHVMLLHMVGQLQQELKSINERLAQLEAKLNE